MATLTYYATSGGSKAGLRNNGSASWEQSISLSGRYTDLGTYTFDSAIKTAIPAVCNINSVKFSLTGRQSRDNRDLYVSNILLTGSVGSKTTGEKKDSTGLNASNRTYTISLSGVTASDLRNNNTTARVRYYWYGSLRTTQYGQNLKVVIDWSAINPTAVNLNKTSVTLSKGSTTTLTATTTPASISYPGFTWSSSNTAVATVNSSGVVTAVGRGSATITCSSNGKSKTCTVTVTVPTTSVSWSKSSINIQEGQTTSLTYTVNPSDSTDSVNVSIGDSSIVSWSNGTLTALRTGSTSITVASGSKTAICTIVVTASAFSSKINVGSAVLSKIYVGNTQIDRVYVGATRIL